MAIIKKIKARVLMIKQQEPKATEYTDLAPIDEITNGDEYINALDWALKNHRVKNIALAGPYGAGKSSIIKTYLKKYPKIRGKSLRISMATFIENKTDEKGNLLKVSVGQDEIELGILKQLFYKVDYKKIPQSRYRKLHKIGWKHIWCYLILICTALFLAGYIFIPDVFLSSIGKIKLAGEKVGLSTALSYSLFVAAVIGLLAALAKVYRSILSRLSIKEVKLPTDMTIKHNEDAKETVFNKNMDEIVYFFEETKYRIVFFEDLDRLENSSIFIQLRELNTILNNYDVIKEPIIFVYAVKDDIFTDSDRTKFFDFIIPVIPIINSTNSGEILLEKLEESRRIGVPHNISQDFVLDVSPYIEDMRILQNIYNEFIVYKRTLMTGQELKLDDEEMMALIIFKNLYPCDFADIQMERGVIKQAFNDKNRYILEQCSTLEADINSLTATLEKYNVDVLKKIREIKISLLSAIVDWRGCVRSIGSNNNRSDYSASQIMDDSFDLSLLCDMTNCFAWLRHWDGTDTPITIDDFKNIFEPYYERFKAFHMVEEKGIAQIQQEIDDLRQKAHEILGWPIEKILEQFGVQAVLSENVRGNKLLVFLLRRGHIDEKYANYINYFKGTSITKDDMNFILSVKNTDVLPFSYSLTKVQMVVQKLQLYEFEQKAIYNFDLLNHMLAEDLNEAKLKAFIVQLSDGKEPSWSFINEFVGMTKYKESFIRLLSSTWTGMWNYIADNVVLTYERKTYYLLLLIAEAATDSLKAMNTGQKINTFVEENENILQEFSSIQNRKVITTIEALEIVFRNVIIKDVPDEVLEYIFDNQCYELNSMMIQRVVEYKDSALLPKLSSQNYTTIIALGYEPLTKYVHDNILQYVNLIVLAEGNVDESTEQIVDLLVRNIDDTETCLKIINHENFCFNDIAECCGNLIESKKKAVKVIWDELLKINKVSLSWDNVNSYWASYGLTQEVIQYIEKHMIDLISMNCEYMTDAFTKEFIVSTIDEHVFETLLPMLRLDVFDISLDTITEKRVSAMINCQYFDFNTAQYAELKQVYPNLCLDFIVHNQEDYLKIMNEIQMDSMLLEQLLLCSRMYPKNIQILFDAFGVEYITGKIAESVISHNLTLNDKQFDSVWNVLNENGKQKLMLAYLDLLDADKFETCFTELSRWYSNFTDRSRRHDVELDNTDENQRLAERLKEVDYITSYSIKNKIDFDPVTETEKRKAVLVCKVKTIK